MSLGTLYSIVWIIWVVSEVLLQIIRRSKKGSIDKDSGSIRKLNAIIYVSVGVGVFFAFTNIGIIKVQHSIMYLAGIVIIIFGLIIRWMAIITLSKYFTVNVAILQDHALVQKGLYKHIRHPSYTGLLISFIGIGVGMRNWVSIIFILVPITYALINRIIIEESALSEAFGDEYKAYSKRTWRLFPGIY